MEDITNKYGYVYRVTNKVNNKIYVGKCYSSTFIKDFYGKSLSIRNAVKEFGKDNFKVEILEWCSNADILKIRTRYWIEKLQARNSAIGYNGRQGGESANKIKTTALCHSAVTISLQIPKDFYDRLKEKAKEECTSVSYLVRRMIIQDINKEKYIDE